MVLGIRTYWIHRVVFGLILWIMSVVFVLYHYQRQSTQQAVAYALTEKNEAQHSPFIRVQQLQLLVESTEKVTLEAFMKKQSEVQLQRHKTLRETCAKHPHLNTGGMSSKLTNRQLIVLNKYKLLYCHIPKVGCTSWKKTLMVMDGYRNRTEDIQLYMTHKWASGKVLGGYNLTEQKRRLESYTKFLFTRHPFERVLSAYFNKFVDMDVYRGYKPYQQIAKYIMKKFRKDATPVQLKTGENITWSEWTSYLTESHKNRLDGHWREFFELCSPCKINYDYIGKLDTVTDDAKYILAKFGVPKHVSYPRTISYGTNSSQKFEHYMSQLSQEKIKKLWEVFQLDFELFGYPKPQF